MGSYKYEYTALNGVKSACNIYIMRFGKVKYIGFENINEGVSVSNSSEQLATNIVKLYEWKHNDCLFFEWGNKEFNNNWIEEVIYEWDEKNVARKADWKPFCTNVDNPFKK